MLKVKDNIVLLRSSLMRLVSGKETSAEPFCISDYCIRFNEATERSKSK